MSNFKRYYKNKNIVFITIVTYNRQQILVKNIELLRQSFKNVKYNYEILAGIVLGVLLSKAFQKANIFFKD